MKTFILAAGTGERLRPLTDDRPKPMVQVRGRPFLEQILQQLREAGLTDIWMNLHHHPEAVEKHFKEGKCFGVQIHYSREQELLGTAGAVKKQERSFQETFLVYYGDNYVEIDLADMIRFHQEKKGLATIAVFPAEEVSVSGVVETDASDRIHRFLEKPAPGTTSSRLVNAGIYVLEPEIFRFIPEDAPSDFGRDIFPAVLAQNGPIYAYFLSGAVIGLDTPELLSRLETYLKKKNGEV